MNCSTPAARASSITCCRIGRSTMVSISFGIALVAGRKRVPRPATGNTALRNLFIGPANPSTGRRQVERIVPAKLGPAEAVILADRPFDRSLGQHLIGGRRRRGGGRLGRDPLGRGRTQRLAVAA